MENLHQFGFFLNEKKSYKDLFPDEIAMVSGITYFGFIVGPPFIGFISDATSLRTALFIPALLALSIVASAKFAKSA